MMIEFTTVYKNATTLNRKQMRKQQTLMRSATGNRRRREGEAKSLLKRRLKMGWTRAWTVINTGA